MLSKLVVEQFLEVKIVKLLCPVVVLSGCLAVGEFIIYIYNIYL